MRSKNKITGMQNSYREYITEYDMLDNLIFEEGKIKRYEDSKQYIEDTNRYKLNKELEDTKRKNEELTKIANKKVKKEMFLKEEPTEHQRKLYLLRNMKG